MRLLRVVGLVDADFARMANLVRQYADLPLGGTDASVVAVAERLKTVDVATIDHRHFTVVRPQHAPAFRLLP
jgi:predicted nucleic acid-binding protein